MIGFACGDSHTADDDGGAIDSSIVCTIPVAATHRASATNCPMDRPSTTPLPMGEMGACTSDDDCTEGVNGRCIAFRAVYGCSYDVCFSDDACDGVCLCRGEGEGVRWSGANRCMDGDCQIDSDCGVGNFCSPTFGDCGAYGGTVGYYCRTCDDECTDGSECTAMSEGYCAYNPIVGHWACSYGQCTG